MQDYESKRKALFDCLDSVEKGLQGTALDQSKIVSPSKGILKRRAADDLSRSPGDDLGSSPNSITKFRGKESLFKMPALPISKCLQPRKTPDFQMNPHKWKKYSLSDVDISDHTNTAAAFTFLKEIAEKKNDTSDSDESPDPVTPSKVTFNNCVKIKRYIRALDPADEPVEETKPKLKGSKLVMPEYVVGQRPTKERKQKSEAKKAHASTVARPLNLSHLNEDDEAELE